MAKKVMKKRPATKTKGATAKSRPKTKPARQGLTRRPKNAGDPRERTASFKQDSESRSQGARDDRTLRSGAGCRLIRPAWYGKLPLTMRIFPNFCPSDPSQFDPMRLSSSPDHLSDWARVISVAKYIGVDSKITFITHDLRKERGSGYAPWDENPYFILYSKCNEAAANGEALIGRKDVITAKWGPMFGLVAKGKNKDKSEAKNKKAFEYPAKLHCYQGVVYGNRDKVYVKDGKPPIGAGPRDMPVVVQVSEAGGEKLAALLNQTVQGYEGDTSDLEAMFEYGDILDFDTGKFVTFHRAGHHTLPLRDATIGEIEEEDESGSDDEKGGYSSWEAYIHDEFVYRAGSKRKVARPSLDKYMDNIIDRVSWFDDILYFPEHDEVCRMLAMVFRSQPNLMRYGWKDNREFFTDEVNAILALRTQGRGAEVPEEEDDEGEDEAEESRGRRERGSLKGNRARSLPKEEVEEEYEDDPEEEAVEEEYEDDPEEEAVEDDPEEEAVEEDPEDDGFITEEEMFDDEEEPEEVTDEDVDSEPTLAEEKAALAAKRRASLRTTKTAKPATQAAGKKPAPRRRRITK